MATAVAPSPRRAAQEQGRPGGDDGLLIALGLGAAGLGTYLYLHRKSAAQGVIGSPTAPPGHAALIAELTISVNGPDIGGPAGTLVLQGQPWFVSKAFPPASTVVEPLAGLSNWAYIYNYTNGPVAHANLQLVGPRSDGSYFVMLSKFAVAAVSLAFRGVPLITIPASATGGHGDYPYFNLTP
jgi:hypothetical protein